MPNMANITVKKNDGTTDITYTAMIPSAGDKSPAIWRSTTVGSAPSHNPEMRMTSRNNGTGTARRVEVVSQYPTLVTSPADGKVSVADKVVLDLSVVIPQGMPTTDINEAVSQFCNLIAATLVKDSFKAGFSPT